MKHWIIILFFIFMINPAKADYITTETFTITAAATITITISGSLTSTIAADTGNLGSSLNINFNVFSNQNYNSATLRAFVQDSTGTKYSAFSGTDQGLVRSSNIYLVMANDTYKPTSDAISDCKATTSTATNNADAIAYAGTVTINDNASIRYRPNGTQGYFELRFRAYRSTDLNMTLSTTPKAGTFDSASSLDEPGPYKVEIYMDNLP